MSGHIPESSCATQSPIAKASTGNGSANSVGITDLPQGFIEVTREVKDLKDLIRVERLVVCLQSNLVSVSDVLQSQSHHVVAQLRGLRV